MTRKERSQASQVSPPKGERGFTLVEVIVALFIFGLLAAAGVSLLSFAVKAQAVSARALEETSDERRLSAILIADLGQAVPRVSRDTSGRPRPAFQANQGSLVMAYVRGGETPQHVELRLEQGRLERVAAPYMDGAAPAAPMVLATGVDRAQLRFRAKGDWQDRWDSERTDSLPSAVELTLVPRGGAPVIRQFLVGTGE